MSATAQDLTGWSAVVKLGTADETVKMTVAKRLGERWSLAGREPYYEVHYSDGRKPATFGQHGLLAIVGVRP